MASVNKVIIVGNLGRDPDIRQMQSGSSVANIVVATSVRSNETSTNEQKQLTQWHRISFFGPLAEIVGQYLKKGSLVFVEGRLQTSKYIDKDGIQRYATDIIAEHMQMLGNARDTSAPGESDMDMHDEESVESSSRSAPRKSLPASVVPQQLNRILKMPPGHDLDDIPF